jgi:hypothetical protein
VEWGDFRKSAISWAVSYRMRASLGHSTLLNHGILIKKPNEKRNAPPLKNQLAKKMEIYMLPQYNKIVSCVLF